MGSESVVFLLGSASITVVSCVSEEIQILLMNPMDIGDGGLFMMNEYESFEDNNSG